MNISQKEERIALLLQQQSIEKFSNDRTGIGDRPINKPLQPIPSIRCTRNTPQDTFFFTRAKEFQLKYPRRKLFLIARNEYDIDKLVCTALRPTLTTYPDVLGGLDTIESCAAFVANFLQYEHLVSPTKLPSHLPSSMQILNWSGAADCFDYSTFLVSLLLGSGYDAYVVQGYALRSACERDHSSVVCPRHVYHPYFNEEYVEESSSTQQASPEKKRDEDGATQFIHSWVFVILHNPHRVRKETYDGPVFIEPTTGVIYPLSAQQDIPYTGVETMWNGKNHWINLQEDAKVCNMSFDVSNEDIWLPVFNSVRNKNEFWEVPAPWAEKIKITESSARLKYLPDGERVLLFYKCKVELFAEGVHPEGLVSRVSSFHDVERTSLICCKEFYSKRKRKDNLLMRSREPQKIQEQYFPCPKSGIHKYTEIPGKFWSMQFSSDARSDGLMRQEELFGECVIQEFSDNEDGIINRTLTIKSLNHSELQQESMLPLSRGFNGEVSVMKVV
jgi:hypothetical protein